MATVQSVQAIKMIPHYIFGTTCSYALDCSMHTEQTSERHCIFDYKLRTPYKSTSGQPIVWQYDNTRLKDASFMCFSPHYLQNLSLAWHGLYFNLVISCTSLITPVLPRMDSIIGWNKRQNVLIESIEMGNATIQSTLPACPQSVHR